MKTLLVFAVLFLCPTISYAALQCSGSYCDDGKVYIDNSGYFDFDGLYIIDVGCLGPLSESCHDIAKIYSCDLGCKSGYTRTQKTISLAGCSGLSFYYCEYSCVNTCTVGGTSACIIANGTGIRSVTGGNSCSTGCAYSTCTVVSCREGYYKKSSTECASCATDTGVPNATSAAGNSAGITDCYIPSGTSFNDSTGSGSYTGNCNYSN